MYPPIFIITFFNTKIMFPIIFSLKGLIGKISKKSLTPTLVLLIQIAAYIANEEAKKILFDLIYDPDRLTRFFKLAVEKNGLT